MTGELDTTKIRQCGTGVISRSALPTTPELKQQCNGLLVELIADKVNNVVEKRKFINKLMCC